LIFKAFLTFTIITSINADVIDLSISEPSAQRTRPRREKRDNSKELGQLKKENEKLNQKLESYRHVHKMIANSPIIGTTGVLIGAGDRFFGNLLESEVTTTTPSVVYINNLDSSVFPINSKIECMVQSSAKRAKGSCNRIIIDGTPYSIKARLRHRDGSDGLIGEYFDGKNQYIAGIFASQMASGALSVAQDKQDTYLGSYPKPTAQNQLYQGLINTAGEATDLMKDEYKKSVPKVFIQGGMKVVILFQEKAEISL
jgi:hypothetical protein